MPWNPDGTRKRSSLYKKSSGFKMKSPLKQTKNGKVKEKKGFRIPGPKETIKTMAQSLKKVYVDTPKKIWKKYGPVINPSTKNPKGVGK